MADLSDVLTKRADSIEEALIALADSGAIQSDHGRYVQLIVEARTLIGRSDFFGARAKLLETELAMQGDVRKRNVLWRSIYIHQLPLLAWHVIAFFVFIRIASEADPRVGKWLWPEIPVPVSVVAAGGLGAALRGMWYLWELVWRRKFLPRYLVAHLAAPFIGVLLGVFTYLMLKAGLLLVTGTSGGTTSTTGTGDDTLATAGMLAFCFFAGYNWTWILARVDGVFTRPAPAAPAGTPPPPPPPPPPPAGGSPGTPGSGPTGSSTAASGTGNTATPPPEATNTDGGAQGPESPTSAGNAPVTEI